MDCRNSVALIGRKCSHCPVRTGRRAAATKYTQPAVMLLKNVYGSRNQRFMVAVKTRLKGKRDR